jgi:drug/metabolite transporter (DMT)-like permease
LTPRQAGLLGLLAALWGASYLFIKYGLDDFSPAWVVFLRTALGALVLLVVVLVQGGETRRALGDVRRRPWLALLLGLLAIAAPFLLISYGEEHVPSGLTAVLIAPAPLFVAALAPLIDRSEAIHGSQALGLIVGLAGVALLVGVETVATFAEFASAVGILAAAACYALSGFIVKNAYRGVPAVTTSCISVGAGALLALPFAVATPPTHAPGLRSVLSLLVLGALGTALAFVIFYRLIAEVGAGRAALVTYLVPPLSLTYGAVLLGETITAAAVAGLLLILAGVALAARRPAATAAPD